MSILAKEDFEVKQFPPRWASGWGQDEFGRFVEFSIPTGDRYWQFVRQRMRWIPSGMYLMGSPEDELERMDTEVQHEVALSEGFWMADTACTQALWESVMGSNPSHFVGKDKPVEQVKFEDVLSFIRRCNEIVAGLHLRLPTEAEWEYACRAAATTPFHTGDQITPNDANYNGSYPYADSVKGQYRRETVDCKSFLPNVWGLYEMHGNVYEWCNDWHGAYDTENTVDPQGPATGSGRVVRGGGWYNHARSVRSAFRDAVDPGTGWGYLGFRCVSSAS